MKRVRVFVQQVTAGNQFTGTLPTGGSIPSRSVEIKYGPINVGGRFLFGTLPNPTDLPTYVSGIELSLGGQSSWRIDKVDEDGAALTMFSRTTESGFVMTAASSFSLLTNDEIRVYTTGATAALKAKIEITLSD